MAPCPPRSTIEASLGLKWTSIVFEHDCWALTRIRTLIMYKCCSTSQITTLSVFLLYFFASICLFVPLFHLLILSVCLECRLQFTICVSCVSVRRGRFLQASCIRCTMPCVPSLYSKTEFMRTHPHICMHQFPPNCMSSCTSVHLVWTYNTHIHDVEFDLTSSAPRV